MSTSRRAFLRAAVAAMAVPITARWGTAAASPAPPLNLGAALITLRNALARDFDGALRELRSTGISMVEIAGPMGMQPTQLRRSFDAAELRCIAAHCVFAGMDDDAVDESIDFCATIGSSYMLAPLPSPRRPPPQAKSIVAQAMSAFSGMTLDDWKWNADRFNEIAERAARSGLKFGYHNHNLEFVPVDGVVPFDELLRRMDPKLVTIELDVGNMVIGGGDPLHYLEHHPGRFELAHLKEWAAGPIDITTKAEFPAYAPGFGRGDVDWPTLVRAARRAGVQTFFLEQEALDGVDPLDVVRQGRSFFAKL